MSRRMTEIAAANAGLTGIYNKVMSGERLNTDDGLQLYATADLNAVGALWQYCPGAPQRGQDLLRPQPAH